MLNLLQWANVLWCYNKKYELHFPFPKLEILNVIYSKILNELPKFIYIKIQGLSSHLTYTKFLSLILRSDCWVKFILIPSIFQSMCISFLKRDSIFQGPFKQVPLTSDCLVCITLPLNICCDLIHTYIHIAHTHRKTLHDSNAQSFN